jgi:hypothetical protein
MLTGPETSFVLEQGLGSRSRSIAYRLLPQEILPAIWLGLVPVVDKFF